MKFNQNLTGFTAIYQESLFDVPEQEIDEVVLGKDSQPIASKKDGSLKTTKKTIYITNEMVKNPQVASKFSVADIDAFFSALTVTSVQKLL